MAVAGADPVRELMAEHRELCEQATDPLEIAAGLEAAGVCAATAGRYRHADVFSLAEELFARVPRRPGPAGERSAPGPDGPPAHPVGWRDRCRTGVGLLGALLLPLLTVPGGAGAAAVGTAAALAL
ncbi:hypothetical protein ACQRUO_37410, partial [Kitasatospora sp. LaBMicrA B282]